MDFYILPVYIIIPTLSKIPSRTSLLFHGGNSLMTRTTHRKQDFSTFHHCQTILFFNRHPLFLLVSLFLWSRLHARASRENKNQLTRPFNFTFRVTNDVLIQTVIISSNGTNLSRICSLILIPTRASQGKQKEANPIIHRCLSFWSLYCLSFFNLRVVVVFLR